MRCAGRQINYCAGSRCDRFVRDYKFDLAIENVEDLCVLVMNVQPEIKAGLEVVFD